MRYLPERLAAKHHSPKVYRSWSVCIALLLDAVDLHVANRADRMRPAVAPTASRSADRRSAGRRSAPSRTRPSSGAGDAVAVFDGAGREWRGRVAAMARARRQRRARRPDRSGARAGRPRHPGGRHAQRRSDGHGRPGCDDAGGRRDRADAHGSRGRVRAGSGRATERSALETRRRRICEAVRPRGGARDLASRAVSTDALGEIERDRRSSRREPARRKRPAVPHGHSGRPIAQAAENGAGPRRAGRRLVAEPSCELASGPAHEPLTARAADAARRIGADRPAQRAVDRVGLVR